MPLNIGHKAVLADVGAKRGFESRASLRSSDVPRVPRNAGEVLRESIEVEHRRHAEVWIAPLLQQAAEILALVGIATASATPMASFLRFELAHDGRGCEDGLSGEMRRQDGLDERLFRLSFNDDDQSRHGRPPRMPLSYTSERE